MIGLDPERWTFQSKPHLAVDTEARHLRAHEPGNLFLIQWAGADFEDCCEADDPDGVARFLRAVAEVPRITMANAGYDTHVLRSCGIIDFLASGHEIMDVQTLARVTMPERGFKGYKLKPLAVDLLGVDADEEERHLKELMASIGLTTLKKEGAHYLLWQAYPCELEAYGMNDVRITYDVVELLVGHATVQDLAVFQFETAVQRELLIAEQHGVLVDKVALAKLRIEVEARIVAAERGLTAEYEQSVRAFFRNDFGFNELRNILEGPPNAKGKRTGGLVGTAKARAVRGLELVNLWSLRGHEEFAERVAQMCLGEDGNPANQTALRCALLGAGVPLYRTTDKSGEFATNKDALSEFADDYPIIGQLFEWRAAKKMLQTYVEALERANPRVHANFLSCEARTSRMSCRSPNMQNLPRGSGARDCIIPAPGNALVVLDFDSIEVRILAHYLSKGAKRTELREAIHSGLEAHTRTAVKVYADRPPNQGGPPRPMSFEEACDWYTKTGGGKLERDRAKETTFSSMYGIGIAKLARRLGVSRDEARSIKNAVLGAIDGYWDLIDALKLKMRVARHLKTVLGRRLDVPQGKTHVYLNSIVQGSAAEAMKLGLLAAAPLLREVGYQVILVVHDELVAEGPVERADEALDICRAAMETVSDYFDCKMKATGSYSTESYAHAK